MAEVRKVNLRLRGSCLDASVARANLPGRLSACGQVERQVYQAPGSFASEAWQRGVCAAPFFAGSSPGRPPATRSARRQVREAPSGQPAPENESGVFPGAVPQTRGEPGRGPNSGDRLRLRRKRGGLLRSSTVPTGDRPCVRHGRTPPPSRGRAAGAFAASR